MEELRCLTGKIVNRKPWEGARESPEAGSLGEKKLDHDQPAWCPGGDAAPAGLAA